MKKVSILLLVLLGCMPAISLAQKQFSFKDGKFKVVQFTDMHWTPRSAGCADTEATIRAVLEAEQPALAVLSGDVVTDAPAREGWEAVVSLFNELRMPFVVTMGNHDAEYLTKDDIYDLLAAEAPVDRADLKPEATLESLNIASLDVISVLFALEDKFGVVVEQADVESARTLGDFTDVVMAKAAAAPAG